MSFTCQAYNIRQSGRVFIETQQGKNVQTAWRIEKRDSISIERLSIPRTSYLSHLRSRLGMELFSTSLRSLLCSSVTLGNSMTVSTAPSLSSSPTTTPCVLEVPIPCKASGKTKPASNHMAQISSTIQPSIYRTLSIEIELTGKTKRGQCPGAHLQPMKITRWRERLGIIRQSRRIFSPRVILSSISCEYEKPISDGRFLWDGVATALRSTKVPNEGPTQ